MKKVEDTKRIEQIAAKALKKVGDDRYKLALVVAKRAEALASGKKAMVKCDETKMKFADIALLEIAEGKITFDGFAETNR